MKTMDKKCCQERNETSKSSSHEGKEMQNDACSNRFYHKMSLFASRTENGEQTDIRIRRETGKPTEITVSRGCDTWELLSSELIRLPEDLRDEVRDLLTGAGSHDETEPFLAFGMENDACD
ncbi:MAG: hypothetical protein Q4D98_06240 [Planctomycetia bacterium]|nr:hypothetical protein [Planctomycetia bacterium]